MPLIPGQKEIIKGIDDATGSLGETPPSLIDFRTLVDRVRELAWESKNKELSFMSFILDSLLDQIMRHVAGHASIVINRDDATSLVAGMGPNLKLIAKAFEKGDSNMLHNSYVTLISDCTERLKRIRVESK